MKRTTAFSTENRGASLNIEYALALGLGILILTGASAALSQSIDEREERVTEAQLEIIGEQTTSKLSHLESHRQSINHIDNNPTMEQHVDIPNRIENNGYTIIFIDSNTPKIIVMDNSGTTSITKELPEDIEVSDGSGAQANNIGIFYDPDEDQYELDNYK